MAAWARVRRWLPPRADTALRRLVLRRLAQGMVKNVNRSDHPRSALLSYTIYPFRLPERKVHTSGLEVRIIARLLDDLGYNVDVVHLEDETAIEYRKYDLLFGYGAPIVNSYGAARRAGARTVAYFPGWHNAASNAATLERVEAVYCKRGEWLLESSRFAGRDWTSITTVADATLVLGDELAADSYRRFTQKPVYVLPAPYHPVCDYRDLLAGKDFAAARRRFLWFGGTGLVHKGLDLLLETFAGLPDLELHVCGPLDAEPRFTALYRQELEHTPNIFAHGFVSLDSPLFRDLLVRCAFSVLPSCSEGGAPSVLNTMGNGGLVPVVPEQASVHIGDFGVRIASLEPAAVRDAVLAASALDPGDVAERATRSGAYCAAAHSPERFASALRAAVEEILAA